MEREVNLIVVHCSATRVDRDITARDIDSFHRVRGFSSWGYHYYVRKDGSIEKMRDESEPGAHAYGHNRDSIGLCYEGGLDVNASGQYPHCCAKTYTGSAAPFLAG